MADRNPDSGSSASRMREAMHLQQDAAQEGFDWSEVAQVWDKLEEELGELREATTQGEARTLDEFGDLLFVLMNLARHLRIDPERALAQANDKFRRRYAQVLAGRADWAHLPAPERLERMEALWQQAKRDGL